MKEGRQRIFYGYVVIAAATFILTIAWGANRTFGVFLDPMLDEFGWTRAGISGAYTLATVIMGAISIVAGGLMDRFGPRVVMIGCGVFLSSSYLLMAQISSISQMYLFYGLIAGIGMSGAYSPLLSVAVRWFTRRRALITGILVAGPALGVVVMPLVFSVLLSVYDWRISYVILGGVVLVAILSAATFLRRDPSEMGLLPYGADDTRLEDSNLKVSGLSLGEAVRGRQFWLLSTVSFCDYFVMNVVIVHIVIYTIDLGIEATTAAGVLSLAAGVSIPARIIVGGIADKIGNKVALLICLFMSTVAFILLLGARELWMLYLFAIIFGFSLWSSMAMISPLTADLFGLKSHATIFASRGFIGALGGAAGPVVAGYIFDVTGSYQWAFIISLLVSVIAIIATLSLKPNAIAKDVPRSDA